MEQSSLRASQSTYHTSLETQNNNFSHTIYKRIKFRNRSFWRGTKFFYKFSTKLFTTNTRMSAGPTSTMMPRNFLPGAMGTSLSEENSADAETLAALYAARAASGGSTNLARLTSASNALLLNSALAEEQRRQALLASQLPGIASLNMGGSQTERLRALILQRNAEQQAFASAAMGLFPRGSADGFGLGLGLGAGLGLSSPLLAQHNNLLSGASDVATSALAQQHSALLGGQSNQLQDNAAGADVSSATEERTGRKGRTGTFPQKMHQMLSDLEKEEGGTEIACFLPHGRAFAIHKPKEFVKKIMPKYFRMSRFSSFQRQLNLYDFQRITEGPDKGAYFHELFVKGRPMLSTQIKRNKIKGVSNNAGGGLMGRPGMQQLGLNPGMAGALGIPGGLSLGSAQTSANSAAAAAAFLSSLSGSRGNGQSPL